MEHLSPRKFSFTSSAFPEDTFHVASFTGTEGLSQCYCFDITLLSEDREIDLAGIVQQTATLTFIRRDGSPVDYHGLVLRFEQLHEVDGTAFYRARLMPRLFCLSLTEHNQVFLAKTVQEVATECLKDGGLTDLDFEFRLKKTYDRIEYTCQYGESHLNFVSRWLEHQGIYYFFEQSPRGEKVIFTDTRIAHVPRPEGERVHYAPPSGLEESHREEAVRSFACGYNLTPATVMLKDYNYMRPSLEVSGTARVDDRGRGRVYSYGENFRTSTQGNRLARVRAESLLCRREVFDGESSVPYISPGYTFFMEDHYRESFNQGYLTTEVTHIGDQTGLLPAGFAPGREKEAPVFYRNSFRAIPATVQFRPERIARKPRISGIIPGKIDAGGSGTYAELDSHGRYKVTLPFDISGRKNGKASRWIRMATPYAGSGHGMHFPLHKGTEVLIAFIDGDADRPVIVGAVPNPETPSPVNTDNQTMSMIRTAGGNKMSMEDKTGSQRILFHSPTQGSYVRIGAPNDPPPWGDANPPISSAPPSPAASSPAPTDATPAADPTTPTTDSPAAATWAGESMTADTEQFGIHLYTDGLLDVEAATDNKVILGEKTETVAGLEAVTVGGFTFHTHIGNFMETSAIAKEEFAPFCWEYKGKHEAAHGSKQEFSALKEEITALKNSVKAEENSIHNVETRVGQVSSRVDETKTQITQAYTQAIEQKTAALATKQEVTAARSEAIAEGERYGGPVFPDGRPDDRDRGEQGRCGGPEDGDHRLPFEDRGDGHPEHCLQDPLQCRGDEARGPPHPDVRTTYEVFVRGRPPFRFRKVFRHPGQTRLRLQVDSTSITGRTQSRTGNLPCRKEEQVWNI